LSGSDVPLVVLPPTLAPLLGALEALAEPELPDLAIIGGIAVNIRLATSSIAHRATADIDVVAHAELPTALEVLSGDARLRDVAFDVIETQPITDDELDGFDDGNKLFLAGHRWALDTAEPVRLVADDREAVVPVATPAGLVAAKSHAAGFGRPQRRATKHGADLYDLFRLLEVFDAQGSVREALAAAPCGLGRLVAGVVQREVLDVPALAMREMASSGAVTVEALLDVFEPFVDVASSS
jgi:nucleotidyltransferase AbiEii toxin of type IV toxin-antitoxin system